MIIEHLVISKLIYMWSPEPVLFSNDCLSKSHRIQLRCGDNGSLFVCQSNFDPNKSMNRTEFRKTSKRLPELDPEPTPYSRRLNRTEFQTESKPKPNPKPPTEPSLKFRSFKVNTEKPHHEPTESSTEHSYGPPEPSPTTSWISTRTPNRTEHRTLQC